jgi:hypothetical protein
MRKAASGDQAGERQCRRTRIDEIVDGGLRVDEAGGRLDEPVVAEIEIVAGRGRDRVTVRADRLIEEVRAEIVDVDVVELLTNHQVGEEAALGRDHVGPEERHLEGVAEAVIVGLLRAEIAGRGSEMDVPAVPVQARDVGTGLHGREVLVLRIGARCRGGVDDGAADGAHACGTRAGFDVDLATDCARPNAAAGLIRRGIGRRGYERAALLGQKDRVDVADRPRQRGSGRPRRDGETSDIVDRPSDLRGVTVLREGGRGTQQKGCRGKAQDSVLAAAHAKRLRHQCVHTPVPKTKNLLKNALARTS